MRWLTAYAASLIGDSVYFLALSWAAVGAGGPTQAGVVLAVGSVPRALLMLGVEWWRTGSGPAGW